MGDLGVLALHVRTGPHVATVLHQQCNDENRLQSEQRARQVLQRIDRRRSLCARSYIRPRRRGPEYVTGEPSGAPMPPLPIAIPAAEVDSA
jgi:hypothetical protein